MKSHVTTCYYSAFFVQPMGSAQPITHKGKKTLLSLEFLRSCTIHKNFY